MPVYYYYYEGHNTNIEAMREAWIDMKLWVVPQVLYFIFKTSY